jgi:hypothetical protein
MALTRRTPLKRTAIKRAPIKAKPRRQDGPTSARESKPAARGPRREAGSKAAEQAHKDALVELGCMVCRRLFPGLAPGPVQLHHLRTNGWGKGGYLTLMPLCVEHHTGATGVHGLGTKAFPVRYGFDQSDLLADALALVNK